MVLRKAAMAANRFRVGGAIRDFTVAVSEDRLIGCGALHFYTPQAAEVRSLAVLPTEKGPGTTYVPGFFPPRLRSRERAAAAQGVEGLSRCPRFQNCDEIAVL